MIHRWTRFLLVAAVATLLCGSQFVVAAMPEVISIETRTFDILIDGNKSGQSTLNITRWSDGTESASTDAKVTVRWTVFSYVYEFHGQEHWQRGRLEQLTSRAVDGGRRLTLSATRDDRGLAIRKSAGEPLHVSDAQLTTNYWRRPAAVPAGAPLTVLDADNGALYEARLDQFGKEDCLAADRRIPCTRFRVQGAVNVELWFDDAGYLVRQVGAEDGHPLELRLVSVQQQAKRMAAMAR
jgi:hypothetical protein